MGPTWFAFLFYLVPCFPAVVFGFQTSEKPIKIAPINESQESFGLINYLEKYMDTTVDPCQDFWKFACGNTPKMQSLNRLVTEERYVKLINMVSESSYPNFPIFHTMFHFYNACIAVKTMQNSANPEIPNPDRKFLEEIGGIPALDPSNPGMTPDSYLNYLKSVKNAIFLGFDFRSASKSSVETMILLTLIPPFQTNISIDIAVEKMFEAFHKYKIQYGCNDDGRSLAFHNEMDDKKDMTDLLKFLDKYNKQLNGTSYAVYNDTNELKSLRFLEELIQKMVSTKKGIPIVVKGMNDSSVKLLMEHTTGTAKLRKTMQNLIVGNFLVRHFKLTPQKNDETPESQKTIAVKCMDVVGTHFGWALLKLMAIKFHFTERKIQKTQRLIFHVKQKLREQFMNSRILNYPDRMILLNKLEEVSTTVLAPIFVRKDKIFQKFYETFPRLDYGPKGPPMTQYLNTKIAANRFIWNKSIEQLRNTNSRKFPETVRRGNSWPQINAFYSTLKQTINMLLGFLLKPMFNVRYHPNIKYGLFGFVAGHEFGHAFDYTNLPNLSNDSRKNYESNVNCLKVHIANTLPPEKNAEQYLGECVADSLGLEAAYRAFLEAKVNNCDKYDCEVAVNGMKLTCEQVFFLVQTKFLCSAEPRTETDPDPHLPPEYRSNVMFQNSKWFAEAYKCQRNAKMNPDQKCIIF